LIDIMAWATGNYHQTIPMNLKMAGRHFGSRKHGREGSESEGRALVQKKEGSDYEDQDTHLRKVACKELLVGFA